MQCKISRKSVQWEPSWYTQTGRQTGGRTDRYDEGNRRFLQVMGIRLKRYVKAGVRCTEGIEFSAGGTHYNARSPVKSSEKSFRVVFRLNAWWQAGYSQNTECLMTGRIFAEYWMLDDMQDIRRILNAWWQAGYSQNTECLMTGRIFAEYWMLDDMHVIRRILNAWWQAGYSQNTAGSVTDSSFSLWNHQEMEFLLMIP